MSGVELDDFEVPVPSALSVKELKYRRALSQLFAEEVEVHGEYEKERQRYLARITQLEEDLTGDERRLVNAEEELERLPKFHEGADVSGYPDYVANYTKLQRVYEGARDDQEDAAFKLADVRARLKDFDAKHKKQIQEIHERIAQHKSNA